MIRVLIVDDSPVIRRKFTEFLEKDPQIKVVGAARDVQVARDLIVKLKPDVLTLDIEMPRMDGLTFLRILMSRQPMPVVVVSSLANGSGTVAMEALDLGAVEVMGKGGEDYAIGDIAIELVDKVKAAANVNFSATTYNKSVPTNATSARALTNTTNKVLAIGASTGGPAVIEQILRSMPSNAPGTLITLHMPARFTESFANRLNGVCSMQVKEARDRDAVTPGVALVAPGNQHMLLRRSGDRYYATVKDGPRVNRHRPSVDILFRSVAQCAGSNGLGVILTGMGDDGAKGLHLMKQAGAHTIAQNEASCAVFGMPRVAIEIGAVDEVLDMGKIPDHIIRRLR